MKLPVNQIRLIRFFTRRFTSPWCNNQTSADNAQIQFYIGHLHRPYIIILCETLIISLISAKLVYYNKYDHKLTNGGTFLLNSIQIKMAAVRVQVNFLVRSIRFPKKST